MGRTFKNFRPSTFLLLFIGSLLTQVDFGYGYGGYHSPLSQNAIRRKLNSTRRVARSEDADTYDFIVVGGGTAGCAVASRLSESGRHSVLLLEAGGIPDPRLDVPALSIPLTASVDRRDPLLSTIWHRSVPQKNAALVEGGVVTYIRGRTLGGSSQVNFMMLNRGSPHDYDNWANLTGDESWNYENMLKYFKMAEEYLIDSSNEYDQHGFEGPIPVTKPIYAPGVDTFLAAGRSFGYPTATPNGPQKISFTSHEFSRRKGRRVSSYTGYIKPFMNSRRNLKVILNAEASQLEFDGNKASGVWYKTNTFGIQERKLVRARKEIIVSGGVVGSPELLLKSGIGPKDELSKLGISPKMLLPVGENLQQHASVPLQFIINSNDKALVFDEERDLTPASWRLYEKTGDGPYSSSYGFDGQAFIASSLQQKCIHKDWADLQFLLVAGEGLTGMGAGVPHSSREGIVTIGVMGGRPRSRGTIKLNSTDLEPLIDFQHYADPYDMEAKIDGIKTLLRLFEETPEYQSLGARLPSTPLENCREWKFRSDEYWRCYVRQVAATGVHAYHAASTCAMGRGASDKMAVVDSKLRVIGIEGLRVVDASIMPAVTNANLQAAVYGIAEKASDMILKDWS